MKRPVGFMQGRLSPLVNQRIQAFPRDEWDKEFGRARAIGLGLMEWTLDQAGLHDNPLLTEQGRGRIRALQAAEGIDIASVTGDCFMEVPFWKSTGAERARLEADFVAVVEACSALGVATVVVPLVDNGALVNVEQEDQLVDYLLARQGWLEERKVAIAFECDFGPEELGRFIGRLPRSAFGINYDIGNSAGLGFVPTEEFRCYGDRIINVHIKDRPYGGTTVPLGRGNADFDAVFHELATVAYQGNFILQTARAEDGDHAGALVRYLDFLKPWFTWT